MSLRTLFFLLVCAAIAAFVGVNWTEMNRPTELSLVFAHVTAPLGLVLVGLMVLLFLVFVGVMAFTQGTVLMETRRHARELAAQRELADKAEASRFTDLRQHLDQEVARLSDAVERQKQDTLSRIDRAEMGLRERPVDAEIGRLVQAVENHNRDLHARVDRLEMGLREGLADYRPALPSVRPAVTHEASAAEPPADPVGSIAPER
ncbi:LapA family protein [Ottowia sp.]|uniref:LapA family protein n=1 Tax=Ottowia sp. TaxID=1898956 RepID=UPI002CE838A2|nr:LapA family protein [Pseudomonadota bacterium]HOV17882.1 LapA family protein [Ottowia sp.]